MKTLYDSIENKDAFVEVIYNAVANQLSKMTNEEIYQLTQDWKNNHPAESELE
jgi:hypothetical protein